MKPHSPFIGGNPVWPNYDTLERSWREVRSLYMSVGSIAKHLAIGRIFVVDVM